MHGGGVYSWPDGKRYEGSYKQGHRHGQGKLTRPSGNWYSGGWADGKEHGEGLLFFKERNETSKVKF